MLVFVLLLVTGMFLLFSSKQAAFSPVRMFLYGWLIVLGTYLIGMVQYQRPLAVETFLLVGGSIGAFVLGAYIGRRRLKPTDRPFGQPRNDVDRATLAGLCLLALIGVGMVASELVGGGFEVITNFASQAGDIRNTYWEDFEAGGAAAGDASPLRSVRFYGVVACLAVATLLPYATQQKRRGLQLIAVLAAAAVVLDGLLSAARFSIGVLALCLLVSAALVYGGASMRKIFTLRRALLGGLIGFYFFVIFPAQRNPDVGRAAQASVARSGDARIADWVTDTDASWLEVLAFSTSYFSTALDKLNYFVTQTDVFSWYTLGAYNLPQLASGTWHQTRLDIADLMGRQGWAPNPWSTGIRDFGIDFGVYAILVVGVLGFLAQYVYDKSVASRTYAGLITATYVSVSCAIFAFISPFQIRILGAGLLLLTVIALGHWAMGSGPHEQNSRGANRDDRVDARRLHRT